MPYDGGEYGEGVLSGFTLLSSTNHALPYSPGNEPRAALAITTELPSGDTITFIGTHLDHLRDETDRLAQTKVLNQIFRDHPHPMILAGDLNDVPQSPPMDILESFWTASYHGEAVAPTYPSDAPSKKIDYVMFYPKQGWQVLERKAICDAIASDHCGYLVTLVLQD
jgi:endonuclease/exonuclease/phosphatase family metal-dependent hydrolase